MNVVDKLAAEVRGTPWFIENAFVARHAADGSARFFIARLSVAGQTLTSTINIRCDGSSADRRALADLRLAGYTTKFLRHDTWAQGWGSRAIHGVPELAAEVRRCDALLAGGSLRDLFPRRAPRVERRLGNTKVARGVLTRLTRFAGWKPFAVTVSRRTEGTEFPGTELLATCTAVDEIDERVFHMMVHVYGRHPDGDVVGRIRHVRAALRGLRCRRLPFPEAPRAAWFSLDAGSFAEARRLRARLDRALFRG